jgi:predicted NBD/HSP70 family sugar kinase
MTSRPVATSSIPATVSDVRQRNRSQALRSIILAGSTSRAELARESGLSVASVTNLVTELIAEGLVVEAGTLASSGGRPTTLIEPNPAGAYLLGADVGERGVAVELFDLSMNRIDTEFRGGHEGEPIEVIGQDLDEALDALQARNPGAWNRMVGLGLGLPGIVETDAAGRQVLYAQSQGWPAIAVTDLISHNIPIFAENGAKTQAMAEMWNGEARGVDEALVVLMGRGVGVGIISDGRLAHGSRSSAGEWGHVRIVHGGRLCRCGKHGCVEAYLGADSILAAWRDAGGVFTGSGWRAVGDLLAASDQADPIATSVVEELVAMLGSALGSLVNLTNPDRVIIGGWVGLRLMESVAPRIEAAIRAEALDRPGAQFTLSSSKFGGDTVALGAAILPLNAVLNQHRATLLTA